MATDPVFLDFLLFGPPLGTLGQCNFGISRFVRAYLGDKRKLSSRLSGGSIFTLQRDTSTRSKPCSGNLEVCVVYSLLGDVLPMLVFHPWDLPTSLNMAESLLGFGPPGLLPAPTVPATTPQLQKNTLPASILLQLGSLLGLPRRSQEASKAS